MRAFVFTDKSLERRAGQFVWLSINTEKQGNAPFLAKFPVQAYPSFFVIDPRTEKATLRWVGGATVAQIGKILDDGRNGFRGRERGMDEILARADRIYGEGKMKEAAAAYKEVVAKAPADWKPYGRVIESLLFALQSIDDAPECARVAWDALAKLRQTPSRASLAGYGLDCALELPKDSVARAETVAAFEEEVYAVLGDPAISIAADDRSSLYGSLVAAYEDAKDESRKKQVAAEWARYLEQEATAAKTPEARAVFDSHRLTAYLELKEPERAIPMLEASERDLPNDYNPPARLAAAYKAMKRWDDALAASDRALGKAYGPRKIGILTTRADIFAGKEDTAAARQTLEEAVRFADSLPESQRPEKTIAALKKRLAAMP